MENERGGGGRTDIVELIAVKAMSDSFQSYGGDRFMCLVANLAISNGHVVSLFAWPVT